MSHSKKARLSWITRARTSKGIAKEDRAVSAQTFLMMHAARLSNARLAWMLRWPKDLLFWNEFNSRKAMLVVCSFAVSALNCQ
jgi:hypothetical protein